MILARFRQAALASLGVAASVLLLVLAFRSVDMQLVWQQIRAGFSETFVLATCLWTLSVFLEAMRWKLILGNKVRVAFRHSLAFLTVERLSNQFLPFRAGEGIRVMGAKRRYGQRLSFLISTLIQERLANLTILYLIAVGLTLTQPPFFQYRAMVLLVGLGPIILSMTIHLFGERLAAGFKGSGRWLGRLQRRFSDLWANCKPVHGSRTVITTLAATACHMACICAAVCLILKANGGPGDKAAGATVLLLVNLATFVPLAPTSLGPFQWGCIVALSSFEVGSSDALAISIILVAARLAAIAVSALFAIILTYLERFKKLPSKQILAKDSCSA